jgi:cytochrome b involved in lipid metabolism
MEEEFKKPRPMIPLSVNSAESSNPGFNRKTERLRYQLEFMKMMETQTDPFTEGSLPKISINEVNRHSTEHDAWIVLNGNVYNITSYVKYHPGGRIILSALGKDATSLFMRYHPYVNFERIIGKLIIGHLDEL